MKLSKFCNCLIAVQQPVVASHKILQIVRPAQRAVHLCKELVRLEQASSRHFDVIRIFVAPVPAIRVDENEVSGNFSNGLIWLWLRTQRLQYFGAYLEPVLRKLARVWVILAIVYFTLQKFWRRTIQFSVYVDQYVSVVLWVVVRHAVLLGRRCQPAANDRITHWLRNVLYIRFILGADRIRERLSCMFE